MPNLKDQIDAFEVEKKKKVPGEVLEILGNATIDLKATGIEGIAIKVGDTAPDFTLQNHVGETRSLAGMLKESAVVVSFYRGGW